MTLPIIISAFPWLKITTSYFPDILKIFVFKSGYLLNGYAINYERFKTWNRNDLG